ncbi:cytochrome P450 [Micromonospora cathayae]|uniref:Cytochrome P450 n=1 Tax=Micromonospora cathayae TaxID=3028804 RepID=A0ABY7ZPN7_9ACTN|nr:cytochrome P450 [Micromonospora sp. HUAS 3]WDZ84823.1 cytochrome P450 [Micromonospora sp. HUAS 3]
MSGIPADRSPDSTLALLRDGYRFVTNRCERYGGDAFRTRLLLTPTICLRGRAGTELFYDEELLQRHGAAPTRVQRTLLGRGGVQGLDGPAHRRRKAMLMSVMTPAGIQRLVRLFADEWRARIPAWERADRVVLYDEVGLLLTRAVCAWAGVPLAEPEVARRAADLHHMIETPVTVGPRYWRGRWARLRAERWLGGIIERERIGLLPAPDGSALRIVAEHRDADDELLPRRTAAVELLNLLRPTVAVDRYVVFAALALHEHPAWRERVRAGEAETEQFVQEVRRFYPFFPMAAARVRRPFEWQGQHFPRGRRVLLDLYATNHHPDLWPEPGRFRPERFADWSGDPNSFVPQGGGEHWTGHRCAGEWLTIALMKEAVTLLTSAMRYDVPQQDLTLSLRRMPALPASRFVLDGVRRTA